MIRRVSTLLLVFVLGASSALADPDGGPDRPDPSTATLASEFESELARGVRAGSYETLYRLAVVAHGDVGPVLDELEAIYGGESVAPDAQKQAATWIAVQLLATRGDLRTALDLVTPLVEQNGSVEVVLAKAWLEDALGKAKDAQASYELALTTITDPREQSRVRLKIALLGKDGNEKIQATLTEYAKAEGLDVALKNRAATVLSLKGHPEDAAAIYEVAGEGTERFRQEVRLADWALEADKAEDAQVHAWNAVEAATLKRDRRYALTVLVEAHRKDDSIPALIERFANTADLDPEAREVWIDLLRETGEIDEALRLFRDSAEGRFTVDMRRELLEMCRESGDEATLVSAYRDLIAGEPAIIEWREGLARHYLERGLREDAIAVWASYLDDPELAIYLLAAAESLAGLGLDDLAMRCAETSIENGQGTYAALVFLHNLHKRRGRMPEAEATLARMDALASAEAPERIQLAEAWEQMGRKDKAVEVLEALRTARGAAGAGEDVEMRLAWLQSEVGDEELALERWRSLWLRIESVPRRRYVEDRLMTVASRLGRLADIAIELEEKLADGSAEKRDSGLLVRLYTKANDAVSATEVIDEYMRHSGGDPIKALIEKGRVFLACTDYHHYEQTIRELIEVDPEGEGDYLRQLAMSQLERGKPGEAREVLARLKEIESGSDSSEFEAGVLALAGMRDEAIAAYQRGIAQYPDRIESYLLMANLLREIGEATRAIGMFQHLAATADKDDLFTIAIDGLLNLESPAPVLRWARRVTLERLAGRHDKMYLYQLLADLSEELSDTPFMLRALQAALPIAGERRSSQLRELMDLAAGARGDREKHLMYGRRLIGLGEIAPPQVYLDLGQAFLQAGEVTSASKTFALATDVPDHASFQTQVAEAFESVGYLKEALRVYERLLVARTGDVPLLTKVGELQEQLGRDDRAAELYQTAMDLLITRRPFSTFRKDEEEEEKPRYYWARNVDEYDQYNLRVTNGVLVTLVDGPVLDAYLFDQVEALMVDLYRVQSERAAAEHDEGDDEVERKDVLEGFPRLEARLALCRRVAISFGRPDVADEIDVDVLHTFPDDEDLLETICQDRVSWGLIASARSVIDASDRPEEQKAKARVLAGGQAEGISGFVPVAEGARLFLPLLASNEEGEARALLQRLDLSQVQKEDLEHMPVLVSAALQMEDGGLALKLGRHWVKVLLAHEKNPGAAWQLVPNFKRIKVLLDDEKYRSLCEYLAGLIIDNAEKQGSWLTVIPQLQQDFDEPLLTEKQLDQLLEKLDGNRWYWLGTFFSLVPEAKRSGALRKILPKVPPSRRVQFVLQLVEQFSDPVNDDFAEFIVESFDGAMADLDKDQSWIFYSFLNLASGDVNLELRLRLVEVPIKLGLENELPKVARAVLLEKLGRDDEAIAAAMDTYAELATASTTGPTGYHVNMARNSLQATFLPEHLDAFLAVLEKKKEEGEDELELTRRRLELVARTGDLERQLEEIKRAVGLHPDDDAFLSQLERQYSRMGRTLEALEVLEQMCEKTPDDKGLKLRLMSSWQRLRNPIKALAIKQELEKDEKPEGEREVAPEIERRWVSAADVKKAIDAGDIDKARTSYRRMWRSFPVGGGNRGFVRYMNPAQLNWPTPSPADPDSKKRARGGLATFSDEEPEPRDVLSAYAVLAEHDFGEDEMRRQVRTWTGWQLSAGGALMSGLVKGMVRRLGKEGTRDVLMGAVERGHAGKLEYGLLLALLEDEAQLVSDEARAMLLDLSRTVSATDVGQIRKLARVWARLGGVEEASRLYRWVAAQSGGNTGGMVMVAPNTYMHMGGGVGAGDLVGEVGEELEGDLRLKTIEQILALSDPGTNLRMPWQRDGYDTLVLSTWIEVLGPAAALEMCRDICASIPDMDKGLRRGAAKLATFLLARAGETEPALAALEVALCKLDPPAGVPRHYQTWYANMGSLSHADIRRLFPKDMSEWQDGPAWLVAAADAIVKWNAEKRARPQGTFQALAIIAIRLQQAGLGERAMALVPTLAEMATDDANHELWVIDVAREVGDEDTAYGLEQALLAGERLNMNRLGEVVRRIAERDGAEAALVAGEKVAQYTLDPDLTAALVEIATAAGEPARAERWKQVIDEALAAAEALRPKKAADKDE